MALATEAAGGANPLASSLQAGLEQISLNQQITFTKYTRVILPLDGFAFWVRSDLINPSSIYNTSPLNVVAGNTPPSASPAPTIQVKGSLHYQTDNNQDESEGFATNRIIFTSECEIEALTDINPTTLYIGEFDGLQFSFSHRNMYRQSGLFHYQGFAVYPAMATQIINDVSQIDLKNVVVSNSLPIWLTLNAYMPMYPSFLTPDNILPPWCTVDVPPTTTQAIQAAPYIDGNGSHSQLVQETVRLSVYGLRNFNIMDFVDYINQYSYLTDTFGIMNMPTVRDEKRTQAELNILAMKKTIEYEINYYQERVRDLARQYITSVFIDLIPSE